MTEVSYDLDAHRFITGVSDSWDQFASENYGTKVSSRDVIGQSIWSIVTEPDLRIYTNAIFFAVRHWNHPLKIPMRCDAPGLIRDVIMEVAPMQDDGLRVSHRIMSERPQRTAETGAQCTICHAVMHDKKNTGSQFVCRSCRSFASNLISQLGRRYGSAGCDPSDTSRDQFQPHHQPALRGFGTG
ncbi:hypothetical protein [Thalassococcus lentus]|uniref:PAS domain-containing protein n=1 Tax=Thalassococcus lentus TaxID=1210524 RepID=A0ABT4XU02_9RHOB|nr:hypothetical protein [Thalassococcus lentus]MDA7425453.1 hypothetical protein [Thalassococcus lentus]